MDNLYEYQTKAVNKLTNGSILCGGVGSGKSRTSLAYYKKFNCKLYIITTAKKRDNKEWLDECILFGIYDVIIDSWNNIQKYKEVSNSFFIFDEQRLVGSGVWVKSFLQISKSNKWILLSATPGDSWMDYIPVFIANGYYKNRAHFLRDHAVYYRYSKFPKIERFIGTKKLELYKNELLITMEYSSKTKKNYIDIYCEFDGLKYKAISKDRWNIYKQEPIVNVPELYYCLRKVANSDKSRIDQLYNIFTKHKRLIIFYNFNYELELLINFAIINNIRYSEWNGHKHQSIPETECWIYLVQYTSGAEGWNCILTNTIVFYSLNYSYKIMVQSAGRIDRLNTPFKELYYYTFKSKSKIDLAISRCISLKKDFNINNFIKKGR